MNQHDWINIVAWMCELWPHSPIEPETANAWWPFVADLDSGAVREAVAVIAQEKGRRFPPGVGDIVAAASADGTRDWWSAWQEVFDSIAGTKGRVRYDGEDRLVAKFVGQLGEWREQVDEANPALRAQFRDFYKSQREADVATANRARAGQVVARLTGDPRYAELTSGAS